MDTASARRIEQISEGQLIVLYGTIYPALLRLEQDGYTVSEWSNSENNRRARYYKLTRAGRRQVRREACRAALKSWTGPCMFSMIFLVLNATVMCVKSWIGALELRTNRETNCVHDLKVLPHFRCKAVTENGTSSIR